MGKLVFSILVGSSIERREVPAYAEKLNNIYVGVMRLFDSIELSSVFQIQLVKKTDELEWVDVLLSEGVQGDFLDILELSLRSKLTRAEIDREIVLAHTRTSLHLLRELHSRRNWPASEFLNLLDRGNQSSRLAIIAKHLNSGDRKITILEPSGHESSAPVPHRNFSAIWDKSIRLIFQPYMVGVERSIVTLDKASKMLINSRSRRVDARWFGSLSDDTSDHLFRASKARAWLAGSCTVVGNGNGYAKSLLIESITDFLK